MKHPYHEGKIVTILSLIRSFLCTFFVISCHKESPTDSTGSVPSPLFTAHFGQNLFLDVDSDSINDYLFSYNVGTTTSIPPTIWDYVYIGGLDSNQIQYLHATGTTQMENGSQICDTSGWRNTSAPLAACYNSDSTWSGRFVGTTPQYAGVRIRHNGLYHYGWIKLAISSNGDLNIFDYACQKLPSIPILAGVHP